MDPRDPIDFAITEPRGPQWEGAGTDGRAQGVRVGDLIDTTEMYLRTVYELEEEGIPPMRARIAERLDQSGPTVSQTVARMERDGLLAVGEHRIIELSESGRSRAARVMRKHRLAECMLVDLIGLPWDRVHAEACRWEHVMSDEVERRLLHVLGNPTTSPFGNPIPVLDELLPEATPRSPVDDSPEVTLLAAAGSNVRRVTVLRIEESAQADESAVESFRRSGLLVGSEVTCRRGQDVVLVGIDGDDTEIGEQTAGHVWVRVSREERRGAPLAEGEQSDATG